MHSVTEADSAAIHEPTNVVAMRARRPMAKGENGIPHTVHGGQSFPAQARLAVELACAGDADPIWPDGRPPAWWLRATGVFR
jgi:hypothetical protein